MEFFVIIKNGFSNKNIFIDSFILGWGSNSVVSLLNFWHF